MHREDSKAKRLPLIITAAYMRPLMFNYGFKFTLFNANAERNIICDSLYTLSAEYRCSPITVFSENRVAASKMQ